MATNRIHAAGSARETQVIRWVVRSVVALFAIALLLYPADWLVWEAQTLFGGGIGSVQVSHLTVAELKGNKEEYYPDGVQSVACSRSLFPQGGNSACWYLRRHPQVVARY
jgi:hypothetical protein